MPQWKDGKKFTVFGDCPRCGLVGNCWTCGAWEGSPCEDWCPNRLERDWQVRDRTVPDTGGLTILWRLYFLALALVFLAASLFALLH